MKKITFNQIPDEILNNPKLNDALKIFPTNYNFEIHKTIWKIKKTNCKRVALQMPEGLLLYACPIADIIQEFTESEVVIMGDVTYGACCIDDYSAKALGCDLIVHYGHSCLIPIDITNGIQVLYVFVDIKIDLDHLIETIKFNFDTTKRIALVCTIQFASSVHAALQLLAKEGYNVQLPQSKPLSPGEILGCTSPKLTDRDLVIYVGDGRFHLESIMIANETVKAYKYDPYSKLFTTETYDFDRMKQTRSQQISVSLATKTFGLILSTLGRQGSVNVLDNLRKKIAESNKNCVIVLMSEIFPQKLKLFDDIDAWIQVACPRLSIDWGHFFDKPLLSPYEAMVALNQTKWQQEYPMDYYSYESLGEWTVNNKTNRTAPGSAKPKIKIRFEE